MGVFSYVWVEDDSGVQVPSEGREATEQDVCDDTCSPDIHLQTITANTQKNIP